MSDRENKFNDNCYKESTANVEEWKRQLHAYKEENTRLKVGLIELEAGRGICHSFWRHNIQRNGIPRIEIGL
jgi:hypothetical protein